MGQRQRVMHFGENPVSKAGRREMADGCFYCKVISLRQYMEKYRAKKETNFCLTWVFKVEPDISYDLYASGEKRKSIYHLDFESHLEQNPLQVTRE